MLCAVHLLLLVNNCGALRSCFSCATSLLRSDKHGCTSPRKLKGTPKWQNDRHTRYVSRSYGHCIVIYCGRVPAANAPGCTAAEGLLYKPWSFLPAPPGVSTRDPSSERRNYLGEKWPVIWTESYDFHAYTFGFFYMTQICGMWQTALLPFGRKVCWGFFRPERSDGFGRVWTRELGYQRPARYF